MVTSFPNSSDTLTCFKNCDMRRQVCICFINVALLDFRHFCFIAHFSANTMNKKFQVIRFEASVYLVDFYHITFSLFMSLKRRDSLNLSWCKHIQLQLTWHVCELSTQYNAVGMTIHKQLYANGRFYC